MYIRAGTLWLLAACSILFPTFSYSASEGTVGPMWRLVSPAHQRDIVKASQFAANIDNVNGYLIGWQRGRRSMLAR